MSETSANQPASDASTAGFLPGSEVGFEPETDLPAGTVEVPAPSVPDTRALVRSLLREAEEQTSALRRARALLVASDLEEHLGDVAAAAQHARDAAEIAPKLSLAAAQARRLHADDEDNTRRRLEATVRLAESGPTRLHAGLLLAQRLRHSREFERASRVLDHIARGEGSADTQVPDARVELERLLHRLTAGEPIHGIKLPEALAQAARRVQELLGTGVATAQGSVAGGAGVPQEAHYLLLLRAARELRAGRLAEATELLVAAFPQREDALMLRAAHLATRRDGATQAKKLLLEALRAAPTRTTWRALALMAVSSGDRDLLGRVLSECDPASGSFETDERLLLLSLCDQLPSLPQSEWQAVAGRYGILARALAPLGDLSEGSDGRGDGYLRLGAALGGRARAPDPSVVGAILLDFEQRGEERPLAQLWRLIEARHTGDLAGQAAALTGIAEWEGDRAMALSALCREALGQSDVAARDYAELLSASPSTDGSDAGSGDAGSGDARSGQGHYGQGHYALAARALAELEGRTQDGSSPEPVLATADLAFTLLARDAEGAAAALALAKEPGAQLARALLEAMAGRGAALSIPPDAASPASAAETSPEAPLDVVLATRGALRRASLDREGTAATLSRLAEADPQDIALGVLARMFDPYMRASGARQPRARFLEAIDVARACLDQPSEARGALRAFQGGALTAPLRQVLHHLAEVTQDHDALSRDHLDLATSAEDPLDRRYAYGRLAEIDGERGQSGAALLFWQTISEEWPSDVAALLAQEEAHQRSGDTEQLRKVQARLVEALPETEAQAYRVVLGATALGRMDLRAAQQKLEPLAERDPPNLLALRVLEAASPEPDDDAALLRAQIGLLPLVTSELDQLACLHEAALAAARLGRRAIAARYVEQAREIRPLDFLTELFAYHLLDDDDPIKRAEALERVAQASNVPKHAAQLWQTAGLAWERAEDTRKCIECLERCLELEPTDDVSFQRLRHLHKEARDLPRLSLLIENRLALGIEGKRKRELELELGHLLIELGSSAKAKTLLEGTLARHPSDVVVLRLHAEIAGELGDHRASEQSLSSLASSLASGPERTAVLRALGRLYDKHFGALEKAMDAYQAALEADGSDLDLMRTLVSVYARLGLAERATQLQTEIIQQAPLPDDKRREALELSRLYEEVAQDPARAGATLERTRRAWPLDHAVVTASAEFYKRQGDPERSRALVQHTSEEARHKLGEGKLDASLLATLAAVADQLEKPQSRDTIAAARAAYLGEPGSFAAAGPRALEAALDDLLSPAVLIAPLRNLLKKTSAALDAAFPIDLAPLDAQQATSGPVVTRLTHLCQAIGQPVPDVFVSNALGSRAVPLTTRPLRLIVGSELESLPEDSMDYLLARALKLQQLGAGALARSRPEDAWPMVVALMSIFAPNYRPQSVDQRKILQARALVEQGLARAGYDSDVPALVLETIGALGRQTEGLGEAPRLLVNRAAMLLAGGPGAALLAMSYGDKKPLPESGPSRYRWIDAHAEAKDLLLFCASDECAAALGRLSGTRGRAPPRRGS